MWTQSKYGRVAAAILVLMTNAIQRNQPSAIGKRVERYRKKAGFASAEKLADSIIDNGAPSSFKRSTVRNLENGRKQDVTVGELLLLSKALKISPLMLIIDFNDLSGQPEYEGINVANYFYLAQWLLMNAYYPGSQQFHDDTRDIANYSRMYVEYLSNYINADATIRTERNELNAFGADGLEDVVENLKKAEQYRTMIQTLARERFGLDVESIWKKIQEKNSAS